MSFKPIKLTKMTTSENVRIGMGKKIGMDQLEGGSIN